MLRADFGNFSLGERSKSVTPGVQMNSLNSLVRPLSQADSQDVFESFSRSLHRRHALMWPYAHAFLERVFPESTLREMVDLPWAATDLDGVSGRRELHNDQRRYFDADAVSSLSVAGEIAEAFQGWRMIRLLHDELGIDLSGTFLRIEHCQDVDGFWLEPHTDIGVKRLTLQCYLCDDGEHQELGSDIYADPATRVGRAPFGRNKAMLFIPNAYSWHGFERRMIRGVRKSLIINYVTNEWRAREQLAFPDEPVSRL
jgi:hypothetical protein